MIKTNLHRTSRHGQVEGRGLLAVTSSTLYRHYFLLSLTFSIYFVLLQKISLMEEW